MSEDTVETPRWTHKIEMVAKFLVWILPLVFFAGVWYSTTERVGAAVNRNEKSIQTLDTVFVNHERLDAHPVSGSKLQTIQLQVSEIKVDQKEMRVQQTQAIRNLSAICQATGADCR